MRWPCFIRARTCVSPRRCAPLLLLGAAAVAYSYRLGSAPLAASEAYSALAAAQPSVALVAHSATSFDPGKPVLYQLLLHWVCLWAGLGEAGVRALSVLCAVASVHLVFALGEELFGFQVGMAAAMLWALNPLAVVFSRWARMYSMLIAFALGHLLAMAKVRRGADGGALLAAGLLGAAMLYVHFGAMLIVAADIIVVGRELRSGPSRTWPAVAIACIAFVPFVPIAISQIRALLFGHWMDWLGAGRGSPLQMALVGTAAGVAMLWLALAGAGGDERRERMQQCLIYVFVPILALAAGSVLIRPMFEVRYVSPSFAVLAVVAAGLLDSGGARLRNLATVGIGGLWAALLPLCYATPHDPWPAIAASIAAAANPGEPIFFEAGFLSSDSALGAAADGAFPQGFFRVPFDYYFHLQNPRAAVPAAQPAIARKLIEARVADAGGAWLVSARKWPDAVAELPQGPHLRVDFAGRFARISVFHVRLTRQVRPQARAPDPAPP
jgi:4-amino-4-deoxy-L-arabinose transferase-like glycosyltransferase